MPTSQISRRALFSVFLVLMPKSAFGSQCSLGDDEWFRRFRAFVKVFNAFVDSLNDGKVDLHAWRDMHQAWTRMDCE
jgi:hypothetical protein